MPDAWACRPRFSRAPGGTVLGYSSAFLRNGHGGCGKGGMRPDMAQARDRSRIEEQPKPLTGFDGLLQKGIHNPDLTGRRADEFQVSFLDEADMFAGRKPVGG